MKTDTARKVVSAVSQAVLEYGCSSVMVDLADAVMPFRTKPLKRRIKRVSMSLVGAYMGDICSKLLVNDIFKAYEDVKKAMDEDLAETTKETPNEDKT